MNDNETSYTADLEADNRRLRRLLEQRDAPDELRHRLRSTLAMLRVIIRKTAETERDLSSYVAHLQDRLDALARAQAAADVAGGMQLHDLLSDELLRYAAKEGDQVCLSGPQVFLQSRAAQVLAMAVHELAVNALEHGALRSSYGRVHVVWNIEPKADGATLVLSWSEIGAPELAGDRKDGFGLEFLTRTLPYELQAVTRLDFVPGGLLFNLRLPLSERIGEAVPA